MCDNCVFHRWPPTESEACPAADHLIGGGASEERPKQIKKGRHRGLGRELGGRRGTVAVEGSAEEKQSPGDCRRGFGNGRHGRKCGRSGAVFICRASCGASAPGRGSCAGHEDRLLRWKHKRSILPVGNRQTLPHGCGGRPGLRCQHPPP